ncbi:MAG: efflux RND transporter periplasmic adaptor subunit, partial [Alphaproteobacteria bacterium]
MTSKSKRWALVGAGMGVAVSFGAAALFLDLPMSTVAVAAAPVEVPAIPVTVALVKARDITTWEEFSGRLEAVDRVQIRSRVAGVIQSVNFREGALVKAGDLLFTIDPAPYQAAVAQAQGQVASAKAKLDLARTQFDRAQKLSESKAISQSDMDQRQNAVTEAEAGMMIAQAALQTVKLELGYTEVRAPVAGRVGKVEIGTSTDSDTPTKGRLQLIDNQVDAASGTIGVRAVFDNP